MASLKKRTRLPKDVRDNVRELSKLNREWVKAGCWSIETERVIEQPDGTKKLRLVETAVRLRKRPKKAKPQRDRHHKQMPDSAKLWIKMKGAPGSEERVEALRQAYELGEEPFEKLTYDQQVNALTVILSQVEYNAEGKLVPISRGSSRNDAVEGMCGQDGGERQVNLYKDV